MELKAYGMSELAALLDSTSASEIEVEIIESQVLRSDFDRGIRTACAVKSRLHGFEVVSCRETGRRPSDAWMGSGNRTAHIVFRRIADRSFQPAPTNVPSFARSPEGTAMNAQSDIPMGSMPLVCSATYEEDPVAQRHTSKTISGPDKQEVMATALRRCPDGARLVLISREDDHEDLWQVDTGWSPASDESHEYKAPHPLFKDLVVGDQFCKFYGSGNLPTIYWEKVDDSHARPVNNPPELMAKLYALIECDPFDCAHKVSWLPPPPT